MLAGLGASVAYGAGLKALQVISSLVFGMSVPAVSREMGLYVDAKPQAPLFLSATEAERLWDDCP